MSGFADFVDALGYALLFPEVFVLAIVFAGYGVIHAFDLMLFFAMGVLNLLDFVVTKLSSEADPEAVVRVLTLSNATNHMFAVGPAELLATDPRL